MRLSSKRYHYYLISIHLGEEKKEEKEEIKHIHAQNNIKNTDFKIITAVFRWVIFASLCLILFLQRTSISYMVRKKKLEEHKECSSKLHVIK